eukprot:PhM_4_TR18272/c0_g2_i1/m.20139/K20726/TMEM222; transmembrane protein 222
MINTAPIQPGLNRYPFCVVWTPLPLITWILPFVGHIGVCDSEGVIHDFAGPFYVNKSAHMTFGDPVKYWQLPVKITSPQDVMAYDDALRNTTDLYQTRMYNFFCNNCHSYVATFLDHYEKVPAPPLFIVRSWNMVVLACLMIFKGKYVSFPAFLRTHLPTVVIILLAVMIPKFVA